LAEAVPGKTQCGRLSSLAMGIGWHGFATAESDPRVAYDTQQPPAVARWLIPTLPTELPAHLPKGRCAAVAARRGALSCGKLAARCGARKRGGARLEALSGCTAPGQRRFFAPARLYGALWTVTILLSTSPYLPLPCSICKCSSRNLNVPSPLIEWPPWKNSISVWFARPNWAYSHRTFAYS